MKKICVFLILALAFSLTNCHPEDEEVLLNSSNSGVTSKIISFDEFKNNQKAYAELAKISNARPAGKMVNDTINGFAYDDEYVVLAEYGEYKTYTFQIYRQFETTRLENLVIREKNNGEVDPYIVSYDLSRQQINDLMNGNRNVDILKGLHIKSLTNNDDGRTYYRRQDGSCFYISSYNENGDYCEGCYYEITVVTCPEGYIDLGYTQNPPPASSAPGGWPLTFLIGTPTSPIGPRTGPGGPVSGGGGGGTPTPFPTGPIITAPVLNIWMVRFEDELKDENRVKYIWLLANSDIRMGISKLLSGPMEGSEARQELADRIIDFAMEDEDNGEIALQILEYLDEEDNSEESINICKWVFDYLETDTDISIENLINWFLIRVEGKDGEYDAEFWENPNLTFAQQNLPTLEQYFDAYPKVLSNGYVLNMSSENVYQLVGGTIYSNHLSGNPNYQNACSIRGSRGLNYSVVNIGLIIDENGNQKTEKGSDNKNYILSAVAFNKWMNLTFGPPTHRLTNVQIGNDPSNIAEFLKGKTGIYTLVTNSPGQAGYSGHVDLIADGKCVGSANANPKGGIKYIEIWVLE